MIKKLNEQDRDGILGTLARFGRAAKPQEPQIHHDLAG
jgi:hypothetical protein